MRRLIVRGIALAVLPVLVGTGLGAAPTPGGAESLGLRDGDITTTATNTGTGGSTTVNVGGSELAIARSGRTAHHGSGHANPVECTYFSIVGGFGLIGWGEIIDWPTARATGVYGVECVNVATGVMVVPRKLVAPTVALPGSSPFVITAVQLAAEATAGLEVPVPTPASNPAGGATIVHFPTWLWTGGWGSMTASASAADVTSTVIATPVSVTWDLGDGHSLHCDGPGVAYDVEVPEAVQSSDCTYSYAVAGTYAVDVTITWHLTWTSPGNGGGDLGNVARTTTLALQVLELDTVIRDH